MAMALSGVNHPHYGYITITGTGDNTYTSVKRLVLKRKIKTDYLFTSVYTKEINQTSDLDFTFDDYYCRNKYTYQYKLVYLNAYDAVVDEIAYDIYSYFDVMVVCDAYAIWYTPLNCSAINFNTIKPYALNTPIYSRKPSYYNVAATNYDEGTCTGIFLEMTGPENNITFETAHNWKYRRNFKNFLTLGNAKILKSVSGEAWIIGVKTDSISDTSLFGDAEIEGARQLEFGWAEIGDIELESNLYENGFINVPRTYWSGET